MKAAKKLFQQAETRSQRVKSAPEASSAPTPVTEVGLQPVQTSPIADDGCGPAEDCWTRALGQLGEKQRGVIDRMVYQSRKTLPRWSRPHR